MVLGDDEPLDRSSTLARHSIRSQAGEPGEAEAVPAETVERALPIQSWIRA